MTDTPAPTPRPNLAYHWTEGEGPAIVFLPGYASDMQGSKAVALEQWARAKGRAYLRFDYGGCGQSEGAFEDQALADWRDDVVAMLDDVVKGPAVLVGSSMGGWLMLAVGAALGPRLAGMVGIAAAPDFTDWGRSADEKARLRAGETLYDDNPYGPEPTPMHAGFFADGQAQLLLGGEIPIDAPVRLIHGQRDADVPWDISLQLAERLRSDDVQVALVKDGDHRLSREQDIVLLLHTVATLSKGPA